MKLIAKMLALIFKRTMAEDPKVAAEEARAFRKGKLTPKYLLKYACVVLLFMFCTLLILSLFFPDIVDISHFLDTVVRVLSMVEDA